MRFVSCLVLPILLGCAASAAPASAGPSVRFDCSGGNGPLKITASATLNRTMANAVTAAQVVVDPKAQVVPPDLAAADLTRDDLVHHWIDGDQINLHFYRKRAGQAPFGYVELLLTTRRSGKTDEDFSGRFRMKVSYMETLDAGQPIEFQTTGWLRCTLG